MTSHGPTCEGGRGGWSDLQLRQFFATALIVAGTGAAMAWPLTPPAQIALLLTGVALIGAPHGIFDIELLRRAGRGRWTVTVGLTALYVGLIGLVLIGWSAWPRSTLAVFLVTAGLHFGLEGEGRRAWSPPAHIIHVAARGASVLVPLVFLSPLSQPWLARLAGCPLSAVEFTARSVGPWAVAGWSITAILSEALYVRRRDWRPAVELAALVLLFATAPPLEAFAIYFAGVHSLRHVLHAARRLGPPTTRAKIRWTLAWLSPAALVALLALGAIDAVAGVSTTMVQALRLLSALALPHLMLGPWLERRVESGAERTRPWRRAGLRRVLISAPRC